MAVLTFLVGWAVLPLWVVVPALCSPRLYRSFLRSCRNKPRRLNNDTRNGHRHSTGPRIYISFSYPFSKNWGQPTFLRSVSSRVREISQDGELTSCNANRNIFA